MRSRSDIGDQAKKDAKEKTRSLKKMRSTSALRERDSNLGGGSSDGRSTPAFDVDEMKRKRMIWEAKTGKGGENTKHSSYEL